MFNRTEQDERAFLTAVQLKLQDTLERLNGNIQGVSSDVKAFKEYLWEHQSDMDHVEKVSVRESITQAALTGESAVERRKRIQKLMDTPWFGRIDFKEKDAPTERPIYVGIHNYTDEASKKIIVYDWRAPVSSLFYDYELGQAQYEVMGETIEGWIQLKRQFRIRQGKMEYMLESSLNIHDEVLQKELSHTSDEKMKNIVATIQRDQNAIIRNDDALVLIIQGVAGSGKTSIALHRIAFLLYKHKGEITSNDIMIISPNKVFADYISNVLPELGEEKIREIGFEELMDQQLNGKVKFQSFFDQVSEVIEDKHKDVSERIAFKATFDFVNQMRRYLTHIENNYFEANDVGVANRYFVPSAFVQKRFLGYHRLPLARRFERVAEDIVAEMRFRHQADLKSADLNRVKNDVRKMFRYTTIQQLYQDFYDWMGKPEMLKKRSRTVLEYADVAPMVYLKMLFEGAHSKAEVKHLLVDEMQDYTPIQYAVLARLFLCKKTILGDASQSVNPYSSSNAADIERVFPGAVSMQLNTSYRSTYEITDFAQNISRNADLVAIERHGKAVEVLTYKRANAETAGILNEIAEFRASGDNTLGIICKSQKQADALYALLRPDNKDVYVLTSESVAFLNGIVITTAYLAKGLEFDRVLVVHVTDKNYHNEVDRSMLYVACTRAMHRLKVSFVKKASPLLAFAIEK
jgi:DNA helicase-2/ATP-dependent DNA helicase PcrA